MHEHKKKIKELLKYLQIDQGTFQPLQKIPLETTHTLEVISLQPTILAIANQKGGVGNEKSNIMESPPFKSMVNSPIPRKGLSITQDYLPRLLSQSNKSASFCHSGVSGSGVGLG